MRHTTQFPQCVQIRDLSNHRSTLCGGKRLSDRLGWRATASEPALCGRAFFVRFRTVGALDAELGRRRYRSRLGTERASDGVGGPLFIIRRRPRDSASRSIFQTRSLSRLLLGVAVFWR